MKIKLRDIRAVHEQLTQLQKKTFPVRINYAIMRNTEALEKEFSGFEKQRIELCKRYANKDEDGEPIIKNSAFDIPEDAKEEFQKEMADLSEEEVEIDVRTVSIEEFEKCENGRYDIPNGEEMTAMGFMIEG